MALRVQQFDMGGGGGAGRHVLLYLMRVTASWVRSRRQGKTGRACRLSPAWVIMMLSEKVQVAAFDCPECRL